MISIYKALIKSSLLEESAMKEKLQDKKAAALKATLELISEQNIKVINSRVNVHSALLKLFY